MSCQDCQGQLAPIHNQNYWQCQGCGLYEFETPLDDPSEPLHPLGQSLGVPCPKCKVELEFAMLHDRWRVCYCSCCRGYVIENDCLQVASHELRASYTGKIDDPRPIDPQELDELRDCPACTQAMETHPYFGPGNVVINSCQSCQVTWLDHGELAMIMRAPGARPKPDSSAIAIPYTHIPGDPVAESLSETASIALRLGTRGLTGLF